MTGDYDGPNLWGFGGWGRDRGRVLADEDRPRAYRKLDFNNIKYLRKQRDVVGNGRRCTATKNYKPLFFMPEASLA
jgi:hypothetical protein